MERIEITEISSELIYNIGGSEFDPERDTPEDIYDLAVNEGRIRFADNGKFASRADTMYYIRCNWP